MLLFLANPLTVFFIGGMVDYAKGAPRLHYMGLPGMEFFNPDPITRCYRETGGCLVMENEWVWQDLHNLGVATLAKIFGPPSRSYDGPYPTKETALKAVSSGPKLDLPKFAKGRIDIDGRHIAISPEMVEKFFSTFGMYSLMSYQMDGDAYGGFVQAAVFENRCLILRIVESDSMPTTTHTDEKDCIVLMDLKNLRPFAYYRIKGDRCRRRPAVQYLPELSR